MLACLPALVLAVCGQAAELAPISVHPENPRYFLFRGRPLVLVAGSEHYGSVVNRPFDFDRYLRDAAERKQTVTRTFLLFREQQGSRNPSSPIKPESPEYVAPWPRTGPGGALDGEPRYDLDRWNPEYFDRLRRFLARASELGIVVELTLFSNTYADPVWALNPLRVQNNIQGVGKVEWPEYNTLRDKELVERQLAYARKIVQETSAFDNVYYEVCNEPGGGLPGHATPQEVDAWQAEVARTVRDQLGVLGRRHLVVGAQAFSYVPTVTIPLDASLSEPLYDAVNVHPLPDTHLGGRVYQMGNFMSKELKLSELRDFGQAVHAAARKPCVMDEDNCASMYRDDVGWTIHRKRAWMSVMTGCHYDFIDFSIQVGAEEGVAGSGPKIRAWMGNLSEFIHGFDFIHAAPVPGWIESKPDHVVVATLAVEGRDYAAYLADARELAEPGAGEPIGGPVGFTLPEGSYGLTLYSPTTGASSPSIPLEGGRKSTIALPPFRQDVVVRVSRIR